MFPVFFSASPCTVGWVCLSECESSVLGQYNTSSESALSGKRWYFGEKGKQERASDDMYGMWSKKWYWISSNIGKLWSKIWTEIN